MSEDNNHVTSAELQTELKALEDRLKTYMGEHIERLETKLLTAFHGWARSIEIRIRTDESAANGVNERVALLEERVGHLERGDR